jgi:hypothetical protein
MNRKAQEYNCLIIQIWTCMNNYHWWNVTSVHYTWTKVTNYSKICSVRMHHHVWYTLLLMFTYCRQQPNIIYCTYIALHRRWLQCSWMWLSYCLIDCFQHFAGTCCLHLQGRRIMTPYTSWLYHYLQNLVTIYQTTQCHRTQ